MPQTGPPASRDRAWPPRGACVSSSPEHCHSSGRRGGLVLWELGLRPFNLLAAGLGVRGSLLARVLTPAMLVHLLRVVLPLRDPALLMLSVQLFAALWSLSFVLYLRRYAPMLLRPRADGLPGRSPQSTPTARNPGKTMRLCSSTPAP